MLAAHPCTSHSIITQSRLCPSMSFHFMHFLEHLHNHTGQESAAPISPEVTLEIFKGIWLQVWAGYKSWACWLTSRHLVQRTAWSLETEKPGTWCFSPCILTTGSRFRSSPEKWASRLWPHPNTDASGILPEDEELAATEPLFSRLWFIKLSASIPWGSPPHRIFTGQHAEPTLSRTQFPPQVIVWNTLKSIWQVHGNTPQISLSSDYILTTWVILCHLIFFYSLQCDHKPFP